MTYFTLFLTVVTFVATTNPMDFSRENQEHSFSVTSSKRVKSGHNATDEAVQALTEMAAAHEDPLNHEIRDSYLAGVRSLISKGRVNICKNDGVSPLHNAVLYNEPQALKLLLDNGALVDAQTLNGKTALHFACASQKIDCAKILIAANADVFLQDGEGNMPLDCAQSGSAVHAELRYYMDSIVFPLHYFSLEGDLEAVEQFYKENFSGPHVNDVNACFEADSFGRTPLHCAVENDRYAIIEFILEKGGATLAVCHKGQTPLHYAAANGSVRTLRLLFNFYKSDALGVTDIYGLTAYDYAYSTISDKALLAKLLPSLPREIESLSGLGEGAIAATPLSMNNLPTLLSLPRDISKYTTLHQACSAGNLECVRHFIQGNIFLINSLDEHGELPLMRALAQNKLETNAICQFLIERGTDLSMVDRAGRNILHLIARGGHQKLLLRKFLCKYPRHLFDAVDEFGNTPLHYAVQHSIRKFIFPFITQHTVHCYNKNNERPYDQVLKGRKFPPKILALINPANYPTLPRY